MKLKLIFILFFLLKLPFNSRENLKNQMYVDKNWGLDGKWNAFLLTSDYLLFITFGTNLFSSIHTDLSIAIIFKPVGQTKPIT